MKEFQMNKTTLLLILTAAWLLTACSGTRSNTSNNGFGSQGTASTGNLSAALQVALGTLKLDKTANTITKEQAAELLPLWETLKDLESSDTAADQEKEALIIQIQETMTQQQMQAITGMNLTRQDMFSILQSQGFSFASQNGTAQTQNGNTTRNSGRNFGGGGGFAGGPPPDGGFTGGGGGFFQGQRTQANGTSTNQNSTGQVNANLNRIPTPLVQAVIDYLKKKAGP
jgi:hypothetical protein